MRKITQREIEKFTMPLRLGRIPRCPSLYKELKEMKDREMRFLSKEEWANFGYKKAYTFRTWWTMTRCQARKGHKTSLEGIELEITTYLEGWVVKKIS